MTTLIDKLLRDCEQADDIKKPWLPLFQDCADYFAPSMSDFTMQRSPGERRDDKIIDSHGIQANSRFSRSISAFLTPEGFPWMSLTITNPQPGLPESVKGYLEYVTKELLAWFHSPASGFYTMAEEMYSQYGAFGNAPLFIGERNGMPYYRSIFLGEISGFLDADGVMRSGFRTYKQTAFQLASEFGLDGLPQVVKEALEKEPSKKFDCIHAVVPRQGTGVYSIADHPYLSAYILKDEKKFIQSPKGFYEQPYLMPRWNHTPNEQYGRGPAMDALGDCRMLQKVVRDTARGIHKSVDPNIIVEDDGTVQPRINMNPGGFWYSNFTSNGQPKVQQVQFGGNISHGTAFAGELRDKIDQHFYRPAFELPPTTTPDGAKNHMSATEFAGRQREQMQFSGPLLTRSRQEMLFPLVRRSYKIMVRSGRLAPPPPELKGLQVLPEYVSPLAMALGSHDSNTIMQFLGHVMPLAQIDQRVLMHVNTKRTMSALADADHVPRGILNTEEEFNDLIEKMQKRENEARQAEQMQQVAGATEKNAKALALTNNM